MKLGAFLLATAALALFAAAPAEAAAPNYNQYCSERFPGSSVTRVLGEYACMVRADTSTKPIPVDYGEACKKQFGAPHFQKKGRGEVNCLGAVGSEFVTLSENDIHRYCERFGRSSVYYSTFGARWMCRVWTNYDKGHYSDRQVDYAQACQGYARTTRYTNNGSTVNCIR